MLSDYEKSQEICNWIGHRWENDIDGEYCPNCNQWQPYIDDEEQCPDCGAFIIDGGACFYCETNPAYNNKIVAELLPSGGDEGHKQTN